MLLTLTWGNKTPQTCLYKAWKNSTTARHPFSCGTVDMVGELVKFLETIDDIVPTTIAPQSSSPQFNEHIIAYWQILFWALMIDPFF